jgi:hypothetical protein
VAAMNKSFVNKLKSMFLLDDIDINKIIEDDDNPPVFYQPKLVVSLSKRIKRISVAAVFIIVIVNIPELNRLQQIFLSFFSSDPGYRSLSWIITILVGILALSLQCFLTYFFLRALSAILDILMSMEFNNRHPIK